MTLGPRLAALLRCTSGSSAAEFAMVLPLFIFFLLGSVDVGRLMWTWNRAEKATQMGVRFAAVTDIVPSGLATLDFVGLGDGSGGVLTQGDPIPVGAFGGADCSAAGSTVSCTAIAPTTTAQLGTANTAAFNRIVARMAAFLPGTAAANVQVSYTSSGLGFAGDPNGADVAPLITVSLRGLTFQPILLALFGGTITLPPFKAALTIEDGSGTTSN